MTDERRYEWVDPDTGVACHINDSDQSVNTLGSLGETTLAQQIARYAYFRLASLLDQQREELERLREAVRWALGYYVKEGDFRVREDGEGPYYWRKELAERAGMSEEQLEANDVAPADREEK